MPIDRDTLDALARRYVEGMTSIRGRRVHRLLMREFAACEHVLPARTAAGRPALIGVADDGALALCCTDGTGATADVVRCGRLADAAVAASHDLLKDSLPVVRWTIRMTALADPAGPGPLVVDAADVSPSDLFRVAAALRGAR